MNFFANNKTYNELLPDFLADRKIALSDVSYVNLKSKFNNFTKWLHNNYLDEEPLRKLNNELIAKFFVYLATERDLDRPTCEKYFIVTRMFFKFALKRDYIDKLPYDLVTLPNKKVDMGAKVIQEKDRKKLLALIKERDPQLYLVCMFEYYGFARPGREIRLMRVGEIDLEAGVLRLATDRAKSRRQEALTMPVQLIQHCLSYGLDKEDKSLYVFGKDGKPGLAPWSVNQLRWRFNKYRDELGLSKEIKLYSFKCTGVTMLAESGAPIRAIMDQCRHTSLAITQHYLQRHGGLVNEKIRDFFPTPD